MHVACPFADSFNHVHLSVAVSISGGIGAPLGCFAATALSIWAALRTSDCKDPARVEHDAGVVSTGVAAQTSLQWQETCLGLGGGHSCFAIASNFPIVPQLEHAVMSVLS